MIRTLAVLIAASCVVPAAARAADYQQASDPRVVIVGRDADIVRVKVIEAAEKVCAEARKNDPFEDFGSQSECIQNTITLAEHSHVAAGAHDLQASKTR